MPAPPRRSISTAWSGITICERPEQGDLPVNLLPRASARAPATRSRSTSAERLADLPLPAGTALKVVEVPPGPPVIATLLAEVYGPDAATRRAAARGAQGFRVGRFVVDVDDSFGSPAERLRFAIDQETSSSTASRSRPSTIRSRALSAA